MAQPIFDDHPLEQYLQDVGESQDIMPGSSAELAQEMDTLCHLYMETSESDLVQEWRPHLLIELYEILETLISSAQKVQTSNPFVEQFKYNVICSSLLSPALPSPHRVRHVRHISIPGRLQHSRTSSLDFSHTSATPPHVPQSDPLHGYISFSLLIVAISFSAGYPFLSTLSLFVLSYLMYTSLTSKEPSRRDMSPTFEALDDLVSSNNFWESVVQEAVGILERDELGGSYGSSNPSSPLSSIRVAIHSSLSTAHTQCDNVRQLLSALTSPPELSQLSEMYAPPSPLKTIFALDASARPYSFPASRSRTSSVPTPTDLINGRKRSTWNGFHPGFLQTQSTTKQDFRKTTNRFSQVNEFPDSPTPFYSSSAPVTPASLGPSSRILPEEDEDSEADISISNRSPDSHHFGAAALNLHRSRKSRGMEAFRTPPASYFSPTSSSPKRLHAGIMSSGVYSPSRFTSVQTPRSPFSLSAITQVLQGALASKRYACSHLLALRFLDEDEGYWEDVRSVIGLLTTTFIDASSRLAEALEGFEQQRLRDQTPTPLFGPENTSSEYEGEERRERDMLKLHTRTPTKLSFAPMPSHISRFAIHVDAISSALDDAREHLEQCVSALKESPSSPMSTLQRHSRKVTQVSTDNAEDGSDVSPALQAYERLRRELGLALRECERGRGRLLDIVQSPEPLEEEEDDQSDDMPALGHDPSDDSDKPEPEDDVDLSSHPNDTSFAVVSGDGPGNALDDATSHLLLSASSKHLPPPGIEQVFESESVTTVTFSREKSKLSREERIKLAKSRRQSGLSPFESSPPVESRAMEVEKWGPGGEIVQELKDVIWKVGERRRKLADGQLQAS